ncbi:MAG: class I tRNA ligase family protein, partial [Chloroflexi bacterium]|nr:class I tRNA ligase family protein [Chloroflexota bacterium]
ALADLGLVSEREPFRRLFNQGQILGEDGERMSKSRGNVQDPDELVQRFGADTVRLFLMFMKPWEADAPWSATGIGGVDRFLKRVWTVVLDPHGQEGSEGDDQERAAGSAPEAGGRELLRLAHRTLRDVSELYEDYRFNALIAKLMELTNGLMRARGTGASGSAEWHESIRLTLLMLAPLAPHIAEELWSRRLAEADEEWRSVHLETWPAWDPALVAEDTIELPVQVNGKLRDRVTLPMGISEADIEQAVMAREKVRANLEGKEVVRFIHVAGRLVNVVVR